MNRFAYLTSGLAIKTLENLSKVKINIHGEENIPPGSIIFVINHFTRIETLFLSYHIYRLTNLPAWSLADHGLFTGPLGRFLEKVGAVSTKDPDRDLLIVKSLLTGEASWIIFPEGRMVKNKKIFEKGRFLVSHLGGKHPPHTGAATLALRTEFYRQRLRELIRVLPDEARRLLNLFQIDSIEPVLEKNTYIVPVNVTYYPVRARENILSSIVTNLIEDIPERAIEEIMTEGSMLLSGVDMDIRFGEPIEIVEFMKRSAIIRDISAKKRINFDDPIPSKGIMRKAALQIMRRYMAAIYSMTTVNLDHLFASLLRMMPAKKIDEDDLRRRVFIAVTGCLDKKIAYLHQSIATDQLHLLTDDRQGMFQDFISVAMETGVVKKKGKALVRKKSRFSFSSSLEQFHRVRIDNPVEVMANEVEPLSLLQRNLRSLAWQPGFWIRHKTATYLLDKADKEFEEDYRTFYVEGESKNKEVGRPFLIRGKSRKIGVVLIHGYLAAPLEVKELAVYLGRQGVWVYVPCLKGHGTSPDDLATRTYLNWRESVDRGYAIISSICKRVVAGGFSTGAGLALDLAARIDSIAGVFAVCPPMKLQHISTRLVPAVDAWNRLMKKIRLEGAQKEFVENNPENPQINYLRNPISGVMELERLMEALEPELPGLNMPALIVQSQGDPVVNPEGSKKVFEMLGSKDKEYILLNFDRHGILLGDGAQRVHKVIGDFIGHI